MDHGNSLKRVKMTLALLNSFEPPGVEEDVTQIAVDYFIPLRSPLKSESRRNDSLIHTDIAT
jgi:hypothetical protein